MATQVAEALKMVTYTYFLHEKTCVVSHYGKKKKNAEEDDHT